LSIIGSCTEMADAESMSALGHKQTFAAQNVMSAKCQ
jgi:hypothetical protein